MLKRGVHCKRITEKEKSVSRKCHREVYVIFALQNCIHMKDHKTTVYQDNEVRTDYNVEGWYCSVTDVVNFITDSPESRIFFVSEAVLPN